MKNNKSARTAPPPDSSQAAPPPDPVLFSFESVISERNDYGATIGLGLMFRAPDGEMVRQAVGLDQSMSMQEAGAALEALGKFFQAPDERLVIGGMPLAGHELQVGAPPALTVVK